MLRHAHRRCVPSPKNGEKPRPCTRHRTLAPHLRRFLCPDRGDSPRSRPTITPYSESKTRFKTHDGPRPPQTPPASSKRPNQKWPGITAEPFSHYLCRATSDWLLTFTGTDRGLLRSVLGPWSPVPKCEAPGAPISVEEHTSMAPRSRKVRILRLKNLPPFRHYRGLQNHV
jgi:hypothetical protein